jgi:hypothetical protein
MSQLIQAGLEVAQPARDRGIDLIAYRDRNREEGFRALPIQVKAFSKEIFALEAKYERTSDLLIVYIWNLMDSARTESFALTYWQALQIAKEMGLTKTASWRAGGRYVSSKPPERLKRKLRKFKISPEKWPKLLERQSSR